MDNSLITFIKRTDHLEDRDLLGGKGAGLKMMIKLGIPVPNGYILTTQSWKKVQDNGIGLLRDNIFNALEELENLSGKKFDNEETPLFVSIRSGAKYSMPGMMATILNLGINARTIHYFKEPSLACQMYATMLKMFSKAVYEIDIDEEIDAYKAGSTIEEVFTTLSGVFSRRTGNEVPSQPKDQILLAIEAVFNSWFAPSANAYRQLYGISDELGTAAIVQEMVFGNFENSGTGIFFTRDINTGNQSPMGDFLLSAQGEEIVDGKNTNKAIDIAEFSEKFPRQYNQLAGYGKILEMIYKDAQDIEFTIEKDHLYLLQTRNAKRTAIANIRIANSLFNEGIISEHEAIERISISDYKNAFLSRIVKTEDAITLCTGEISCLGCSVGRIVLDIDKLEDASEDLILITDYVDPNNISLLRKLKGVITTKGNPSSHMGLVFKALNIPSIVGSSEIEINDGIVTNKKGISVKEGDYISLDASNGVAYLGALHTVTQEIDGELEGFLQKWNQIKGYSAWASTLYEDVSAPDIHQLSQTIETAYLDSEKLFKSQKARVIRILNQIFDEKVFIRSEIHKPNDVNAIKKSLEQVITAGYSNAPRTCHYPEKLAGAPWSDGPNRIEDIENFLTNAAYPGKYGGYPKWIEDKTLDAVLVSWEPVGKMDSSLASQHIAVTLSMLETTPLAGLITIHFGSPHLRTLEDVHPNDIVKVRFVIDNKFNFNLGNPDFEFGQNYYSEEGIATAYKEYLQEKSVIRNIIHENFGSIGRNYSFEEFNESLYKLIVKRGLYDEFYNLIIKNDLYKITSQIFDKVEELWKPPYYLPFKVAALDKILGLSTIEMQGRYSGDKLLWFKIYGAKGSEEKEKIAKAID